MKHDTIINIILVISILMAFAIAGCTSQQTGTSLPAGSASLSKPGACQIDDFGHGVLIFECRGSTFAQALSGYLDSHMVVVSSVASMPSMVCPDANCGYIVTVR